MIYLCDQIHIKRFQVDPGTNFVWSFKSYKYLKWIGVKTFFENYVTDLSSQGVV